MFILLWLQNESNLPICQWVSEKGVVVHCICEILFGCVFFFTGHRKGGKMQSLCQFCVFTHVASIYAILLKQKKRLHKKSSTSTGLVWDTNMAAVSLFWDTNIATVTSCENTQYIHESRSQKQTFVEPSCSTCPVPSVVPPPCASLTSSAAIPSTFCNSPFVWLYSGCPPSVTVWEKSYKQSISICINKLKLLSSNHLQWTPLDSKTSTTASKRFFQY